MSGALPCVGVRDLSGLYDADYFATSCGVPYRRDEHWLDFFGGIAERIVVEIAPRTALDAGCAMGFLVEALRDRGVDCYGVDVSEYAIAQVREDIRPYCWQGMVTDPLPQTYDLVICIEVLEHLAAQEAERAIANLCRHTDDILFSSTPTDREEPTHVNVRPPDYWAEAFARHGFYRDLSFDASFVAAWGVRFCRGDRVDRVVGSYERKLQVIEQEIANLGAGERRGPRQPEEPRREGEVAVGAAELQEMKKLLHQRDAEVACLRDLVDAYERGRFMRLMRWLKAALRRVS
jgi:hypothetical protein